MKRLAEIEAAADELPAEQKQELLLFLAARLRAPGARLPEPRKFSREQMAAWIAEDEEDMRRLREGV
jgi:parvulin-like peptidyl-prolyl isomerase